jgi:hypothetical protein
MNRIPKYKAPDFSQEKFTNSPEASTALVAAKGIAPDNYHATSMYPEYYKINGRWRLIERIRMDCVPVIRKDGSIEAVEFRRLEIGDCAVLGRSDDGSEGIYLHSTGFTDESGSGLDAFSFRSGRSRETSFLRDYKNLADLLKYDKDNGYIVWVLGPAAVFSNDVRKAMEYILDSGYAHAVFGGNAVVTHDLEGALLNTALGQDIDTGENRHNGHYNHLDTINMINRAGSVQNAIKEYGLDNGVIYSCVKNNIPFVMAASVRDDGPMAGVLNNMSEAQDAMRAHTQKATIVVGLATQLHTIATGNLTPSYTVVDGVIRPVFIYAVDVSEFVLNKLRDRGSMEVTTIVSNVQDFLFKLTAFLKKDA